MEFIGFAAISRTNQMPTGDVDVDGIAVTRDATAAEKVGGSDLSISYGSSKSSSKTT